MTAPKPRPWAVGCAPVGAEQAAVDALLQAGCADSFVPVVGRFVRVGADRRRREVPEPLWPGYLAVDMTDPFDWAAAIDAGSLYGLLKPCERGQELLSSRIEEVRTLDAETTMLPQGEPLPAFLVGQRVWVTGGPFEWREGCVTDAGPDHVCVGLDLFGRTVEVPFQDLTKLAKCV